MGLCILLKYLGLDLLLVIICNVMFDFEEMGFIVSFYIFVGCVLMLCGYCFFVDMMLMVSLLDVLSM